MNTPYNMNYTINGDLREIPDDWKEFEKGIIFLEKKLTDTNTNLEKAEYLSKLGVLNRIAGHLDKSLKQLADAQLIICNLDNEKLYIVNEIRLASTLQFQGEFEAAEQIYTTLEQQIKTTNTHENLLDFIYQHKGKNYYEWRKLSLALGEFEKALSIRRIKGNEALIHSTEIAIKKIRELIWQIKRLLMQDITIRKATLNDMDTLLRFEQGVIEAERPMDSTLDEDIHYYDLNQLITAPHIELLVAEKAGNIVASGYARIESAKHYLKYDQHAYLGFMYVTPKCRGQGINQLIIDQLKAWSVAQGVTELRLDVYETNAGAIRAYQKVGFEKHMIEMRMSLKNSKFQIPNPKSQIPNPKSQIPKIPNPKNSNKMRYNKVHILIYLKITANLHGLTS